MFVLCNEYGNCYKVTDSVVKRDQLLQQGYKLVKEQDFVKTDTSKSDEKPKRTAAKKPLAK